MDEQGTPRDGRDERQGDERDGRDERVGGTAGVPPVVPVPVPGAPTQPAVEQVQVPGHVLGQVPGQVPGVWWPGQPLPTSTAHAPRSGRGRVVAGLAAALALGVVVGGGGTAVATGLLDRSASTVAVDAVPSTGGFSSGSTGSTDGSTGGSTDGGTDGGTGGGTTTDPFSGSLPSLPGGQALPWQGGGPGSSSGSTQTTTDPTAAQEVGVVTIYSTLGYAGAESAGTGMVLTADGLVLTNNHVVDGATQIQVTVESTGQTYTAEVVGTDATHDVAVLQLEGASGLSTVTLDDDGDLAVSSAVTAIGNAEGTGDLVAAAGTVTGLDQTITTSSEGVTAGETLNGLVQFSAGVVSGDSGGPLLDAEGEVVGMTTAASSGSATVVAFAIDIEDALVIVHQIESGDESGTVTIGLPAFLGVEVAGSGAGAFGGAAGTTGAGATIAGVLPGTPAATAGLAAGDTITAVGGKAVTSADELTTALAALQPGDAVAITWTSGTTGASQTATVTLAEGPAA